MKKLRERIFRFVAVLLSAVLICFVTACDIQGVLDNLKDGDIDGAIDKVIDGVFPGSNPIKNQAKGESELRVHFLDVGQGDSILVELPDDTVMLIDSGDGRNSGKTEISTYIVNYLNALKITVIDYLVATHSDADHVGNMVQVLDNFEVETAYVPKLDIAKNTWVTKTYEYFYDKLLKETYTDSDGNKQQCEIKNSYIANVIESESEQESFFIAFLAPTDTEYDNLNKTNPSATDKNAVSPIMFLEYMEKRILFTGDTVTAVEEKVVKNFNNNYYNKLEGPSKTQYGVDLENIDILKVAHHGGDTSTCLNFLSLTKPKFSVISSGGEYGHPHQDVLARLTSVNSTIYRTDQVGTVVASVYPDATKDINFSFTVGYKAAS